MTYIDKVKHILDNYNFCTYQEDIRFGDVDISNPSTYFWRLFTQHFYQIPHTNSIFHDKELFNFLRNYDYKDEFDLKTCLERDKKFILQMDLHPATSHNKPFELIKTKFFDYLFSKKEIIESMKSGKMTLFLYQGWEAENYTISWWPDDKYKTFYHMIKDVLQEYGLSYSSIVVLNSNVKLYNHKHNVNVIYDNAMEMNSFKRGVSGTEYGIKIKDFDETYSVDDYLDKVKNSKYKLLRISRTPQHLRDKMLYFLYKSNFHNKSVIEHRYYDKNNIIDDSKFFQQTKKYCKQNNLTELIDLFDYDKIDKNILNNIDKDIPLIGSPYEKKQGYHKLHLHPNSPIPFDVYEKSIFTWASTSLPDQDDKVFLNQSTFNPILNYHPVIWHGQKHTTKWFKYFGFKSYEWLFENETKADDTDCIAERFVLNMQDIIRVMNMSDDELYNRIKDNKDTLQHNRDLLFQCKSIERIITKFFMKQRFNIVVPMAGRGSRFTEQGYTDSKPFIDVNGKPMIQRVIENLGIEFDKNYMFVLVCLQEDFDKYDFHQFKDIIGHDSYDVVILDDVTEGAAQTILQAKDLINDDIPLLTLNTDQMIDYNPEKMWGIAEHYDGYIPCFWGDSEDWSYARILDNGYVQEVAEKKVISNNATAGYYYWKKGSDFVKYAEQMIEQNSRTNGEFYVAPVYNWAILDGKKIGVGMVDKVYELGTPEYLERYLEENNIM